jgi:ParB family transcriptional regulator, chromosome partitioning protein
MSKIRPVLGRGLASLIPRQPTTPPPVPEARPDDGTTSQIIASVDIERIRHNPYQPRADFDPVALDELKRSIMEKGIIQPITVRRYLDGYQLISGERRVRAARDAGLSQVPAYIIDVQTDEEMLELALIENLQREHLNPVEIAISYRRLIDECSFTQEEVSQRIGKDRTTVTNFLRLLRLPDDIQLSLRRGEITFGHARALVAIEDPKLQREIFRAVVTRELSVRDVERLVRDKSRRRSPRRTSPETAASSALSSVEDTLRRILSTKVQVKPLSGGKGEILIEYYSADDLERLLDLFHELEGR